VSILTTGSLSGLGKHLYESLGGLGWTRRLASDWREEIGRKGVEVIIHCAFNSSRSVNSESIYGYLQDNVLLTKELVSIPHQKFILISSVDVYPQRPNRHQENELIDIHAVNGIYGMTKLMSEAIVRQRCSNHLILRCVSLLGEYSRKNSLIRIIEDEPCRLTLSGDSRLNCVLYPDVSDFIRFAIGQDAQGIFNISSAENLVLSAVADRLGKKVRFGTHRYEVGDIDNSKASSIFPAFRKTSMEVIAKFARERVVGIQRCR